MPVPTRRGRRIAPPRRRTFHLTMPVVLLIRLERRIIVRVETGDVCFGVVPVAVEVRVTAVTTSARVNGVGSHGIVHNSPRGLTSHLIRRDRKTAVHGRRHPLGRLDGMHGSHGHRRSSTRDRVTERWSTHRRPTLIQAHVTELVGKAVGIVLLGRQRGDGILFSILICVDLGMY